MADEADLLDHPPVVIFQSQEKLGLLLLGCLAFCGIGVWSVLLNASDWMGWLALAIFGLCTPIILAMRIWPGRLVIDQSGFRWTILFRTWDLTWSDVTAIKAVQMRGAMLVGWKYSSSCTKYGRMRKVNEALAGCDGAISGNWTLTPSEVVDLLNRAKERWDPS
jgi:hypothetical protein